MGDCGAGHSHSHASHATLGGHDHGHQRGDGNDHALVEDVALEDDQGGGGRRYVGAGSGGANLSEAEANQR